MHALIIFAVLLPAILDQITRKIARIFGVSCGSCPINLIFNSTLIQQLDLNHPAQPGANTVTRDKYQSYK
jgi:hypothetical protein